MAIASTKLDIWKHPATNYFEATVTVTVDTDGSAPTKKYVGCAVPQPTSEAAIADALREVVQKLDHVAGPRNVFQKAMKARENRWLPANGGTETEFVSRSGHRLLYCYNPALGKHAYLDLTTDIVLTDEEARLAMQM